MLSILGNNIKTGWLLNAVIRDDIRQVDKNKKLCLESGLLGVLFVVDSR